MSERDDERGFKVQDRRRFDAEGNRRAGDDERPSAPAAAPQAPRPAAPQAPRPAAPATPARPPVEEEEGLGFSEFILSLGTNAAQLLGGDDAESVPSRPDLVNAAQHIDILGMLHRKTAGNLTAEEQQLLESMIYDLRMRYLEVVRALQGMR